MWVVEWEEGESSHSGGHRHQAEAVSEAAAHAQAHELRTGRGLRRVVYYWIEESA